jgi:bifunctional DNA-binding transcriptional regulator/antitoxin component of YhaV-PrlF toxin-antitoxin module
MRMTSRGRVTIPIALRKKARLLPNTVVEFDYDGEYVRIRRARRWKAPGRGEEPSKRGRGNVPMTTEEIMALMRSE